MKRKHNQKVRYRLDRNVRQIHSSLLAGAYNIGFGIFHLYFPKLFHVGPNDPADGRL